jgi:hypothetical protein
MKKARFVISAVVGLMLAAMIAVHRSDSSQPSSATGPAQSTPLPCEGLVTLYLNFSFPNREAPWQRGRSYELELSLDGSKTVCSFEVPVRTWLPEMGSPDCRFTLQPSGEPAGLALSGRADRIELRVLSGGQVFYRGSVSPQYERVGEGCNLDVDIGLLAVEHGEN